MKKKNTFILTLALAATLSAMPVSVLAEVEVEHIQQAIDSSNLLTSTLYAVIPGKGNISMKQTNDEFLSIYARLNLKKLVVSRSTRDVYALTKNGELYFNHQLVDENVVDMVHATTNVNEEGWYIKEDGSIINISTDFDTQAVDTYVMSDPIEEKVTAIAVDKHDFFAARSDGLIASNGDPEDWINCDYKSWTDEIAVLAVSKVVGDEYEVPVTTVAAITSDGRTLATGDSADEILTWGSLSYISMNNGLIAGLLPDGTVRVAGINSEEVTSKGIIESLKNVTGIFVSGDYFSAVDADGTYHFISREYDDYMTVNASGVMETDGQTGYLYTADGYYYMSTEDAPAWVDENGNVPAESVPVALTKPDENAIALPEELNSETTKEYIMAILADKASQMEAQRYNFNVSYRDGKGLSQVMLQINMDEQEVDLALVKETVSRVLKSELFNLSQASYEALDAWEPVNNYPLEIEGWEIDYSDMPFGGMVVTITYY